MKVSIKSINPEQEVTLNSDSVGAAAVIRETERYSITPTTFNERIFEENLDNWWYKDEYQVQDNKVMRFGINIDNHIASEYIIGSIEKDSIRIIDKVPSRAQSEGASQRSSSKKSEKQEALTPLATLEQEVLIKAISYLLDDSHSVQRAVLVDIFARDEATGAIVRDSSQTLEIHTVVLYKNPTMDASVPGTTNLASSTDASSIADTSASDAAKIDIFVIDPSNSKFSSHLAAFGRQATRVTSDVASEAAILKASTSSASSTQQLLPPFTVTTIDQKQSLQIYKKPSGATTSVNGYRDCIDLAAKIALGLNNIPDSEYKQLKLSTLDTVKQCSIIQMLTNSPSIDTCFLVPQKEMSMWGPVRIKQTSDIGLLKRFYTVEQAISKLQAELRDLGGDDSAGLQRAALAVITNSASGHDIVEKLCNCHGRYTQKGVTMLRSKIELLYQKDWDLRDVLDCSEQQEHRVVDLSGADDAQGEL